jgi:hypothetical protein
MERHERQERKMTQCSSLSSSMGKKPDFILWTLQKVSSKNYGPKKASMPASKKKK